MQLCFVNVKLNFSKGTDYLKFWFNLEQILFTILYHLWNKYQIVNSYLQLLIRERDMMFLWWNFTSNFLGNQPTRQRSMPMSAPSSHWWWSHCIWMIPITSLKPEFRICIISEQKWAERLIYLTCSSNQWLQIYRMFYKHLQQKRRILTGLI